MQTRYAALLELQGLVGVHEVGGNNRGPMVEAIQRADTLPGEVYAWCQSLQNAGWRLATGGVWKKVRGRVTLVGGDMLAGGTASVWAFSSWCEAHGFRVSRPLKGDHVCFSWKGTARSSVPGDHVGIVERVLALRPLGLYWVQTIEGNVSPVGALDASDANSGADGVYRKRRWIRSSDARFYRVRS